MASFSLSTLPTTAVTAKKTNTFYRSPLFSKTSSHRFQVSCNTPKDDNNKTSETSKLILPKTSLDTQNIDRRNVLLGLGGLYGAANLTAIQSASAVPIKTPDNIASCEKASDEIFYPDEAIRSRSCCPLPTSSQSNAVDYVLPTNPTMRVRPAAHVASNDPVYVKKYRDAIAKMRKLPDTDPCSWKNQAKVHCAYCNGAFTLENSGDKHLQIHFSWHFFPFHRWYLYFYERILGRLIDDQTFALPYWNWDNNSDGMAIPPMFEQSMHNPKPLDPTKPGKAIPIFNPLFDVNRNPSSFDCPPGILNFSSFQSTDPAQVTEKNQYSVYSQMNTCSKTCFFGGVEKAGGLIENGVHTEVHKWVGTKRLANNEDMGNFYSAGYDPVFYCHHANVDRMWNLWKDLKKTNKEPVSDDWRNASYVFYDENRKLVRVYNKDCIDTEKMGYKFESSQTPWTSCKPTPHARGSKIATKSKEKVDKAEKKELFPVRLNEKVKLLVKRPPIKENEVLIISGIECDGTTNFKFNVFVNDVEDGYNITPCNSEFAGTFGSLQDAMKMKKEARFEITARLNDLIAEDDYILVTLVPVEGTDSVTISDISIITDQCE